MEKNLKLPSYWEKRMADTIKMYGKDNELTISQTVPGIGKETYRFTISDGKVCMDTKKMTIPLEEFPSGAISQSYGIMMSFKRIKEFENLIGDYEEGGYFIISGQPGVGAVTMATRIAFNAAVSLNQPLLCFSFKSSYSGIAKDMAEIAEEEGKSCETLYQAPIFIQECNKQSIQDIQKIVRKEVKKKGIQFVMIDCLNLIADNENSIPDVSDKLRTLSRECRIKILAVVLTDAENPVQLSSDMQITF